MLGTALRAIVTRIRGTRSVVFESLGGETRLTFEADPEALPGTASTPRR